MIHYSPFIPHSYAHLEAACVFPPGALPELAYTQYIKKFQAIDDVAISRITYTSDGLTITGVAALPSVITPGAHPVVIYNRGGSKEYGKLTLVNILHAMVPLARAGCLVFASNYRGNDGSEGREEFGGKDVDDVLALLNLAREHAGFDGKNACMAGHSRGAMMLFLALKAGADITAAVSIAGMSDVRERAKADPALAERVFNLLMPEAIADKEKAYAIRSAICWPEAIRVPTLLLHGDGDEVIPVSQSQAMHAALQAQGTPSELVVYPGGNHALVRQFEDIVRRIIAWMKVRS